MAQSLYQFEGHGNRPASLYRQNQQQHPTLPPGSIGAPPSNYNYGSSLPLSSYPGTRPPPSSYPGSGPPAMAYTPYSYAPSANYDLQAGPSQSQFSSSNPPPSYPAAPPSSFQPSIRNNFSFSSIPNLSSQSRETASSHPMYYAQSVLPLSSHATSNFSASPNRSSVQPSSHGSFYFSQPQQQSLLPPQPQPHNMLNSHPASYHLNMSSSQPSAPNSRSRLPQEIYHFPEVNANTSREASTIGTTVQDDWASARDGRFHGSLHGSWGSTSLQAAAPAAQPSLQVVSNVQGSYGTRGSTSSQAAAPTAQSSLQVVSDLQGSYGTWGSTSSQAAAPTAQLSLQVVSNLQGTNVSNLQGTNISNFQGTNISNFQATTVGALQSELPLSPARDGRIHGSLHGAWASASSQASAPAAQLSLQAVSNLQDTNISNLQGTNIANLEGTNISNLQDTRVGALQAELALPLNPSKPAGVTESSRLGSRSKMDKKQETEEQRRERKKKEYEKKKLEKKKRKKDAESSDAVQKSQMVVTPKYVPASKDVQNDKKSLSLTEKAENRLKRPSTFFCKIRFRNELPDPLAQPKFLHVNYGKDQYTKYSFTSLEKAYKHKLLPETDLGVPLDLLDLTVYNAPEVKPPLDPEDEELLRDDEVTPMKTDGIRKKERPTDKGVAWLVKTQYISLASLDPAKQALTEKQAKELKEQREGKRNFLEALNDREQQIQSIEESFRVAKQRPVHQAKPGLEPVQILPLLPDFNRWRDQLVHMIFDGEPTVDSELHRKLDAAVRGELEAKAIMKSYVLPGTESVKSEKFLAYMVPEVELVEEVYEKSEEIQYSWVREYLWDVRAEDAQNPATYLFSFDEDCIHYQPLGTKLTLQKKRSKEGRSKDEAESRFAVPESVVVRRRELTQEEKEDKERQRARFMEGFTSTLRGPDSANHRESPEEELPPSKRRSTSKELNDADDENSM